MIFPTDELYELRRRLNSRMDSGELLPTEVFRQALAADPADPAALRYFALEALDDGNAQKGEDYAREAIRTHPGDFEGYLLLARALKQRDPASPAVSGFLRLAIETLQLDSEADIDREHLVWMAETAGLDAPDEQRSADEIMQTVLERLAADTRPEPETATRELLPYRLIYELYDHSGDVLDASTVDAILQNAERCAPLLTGILNQWGEGLLPPDHYSEVERSLALLGEIGDPAALPTLLDFLTLDEDDLAGPADWAFRRILSRRPEESLERIRALIPNARTSARVVLAELIGLMPEVPGRVEVIEGLTQGIERIPLRERAALVTGTIGGLVIAGKGQSAVADALETQYAGIIEKSHRAQLRDLRHAAAVADAPPEDSIYDICCREPAEPDPDDVHDHDHNNDHGHDHVETIHRPPRPGRNDPCWCGSGKKYKKCHLSEDELAQ
jgi:hypothetical protein